MFLIASFAYAMSIFIDVSAYHLKYNIHDNKNVRYLFSLINIFQFSARAFVLIFVPIMAYYTETIKDKDMVWEITLLSHVFVVMVLLPLYSSKFSYFFSKKIIQILNIFFGKSKEINYVNINDLESESTTTPKNIKNNHFTFALFSYASGFFFSFSITFLYYLSFSYPQKALTLTSYSQILNMFGVLLLVLLIDPKIMSAIDHGQGRQEIKLLTTSRIFVHITLILILLIIK